MKKTLIATTSAFALVLGLSGAALADSDRSNQLAVAVSVQILDQYVSNYFDTGRRADVLTNRSFRDGMANGNKTFQNQTLNVNGFNQGINGTNQGAISLAVAVNL